MDSFKSEFDKELAEDKFGNWYTVSIVRMRDLILKDTNGNETAKLINRLSVKKIWWNNGPVAHIITYSHIVEVVSASTTSFGIKIDWENQGGGIEKSETITDFVTCRDSDREVQWSFSSTEEIFTAIKKVKTEQFGPSKWSEC